MWYKSREGYWYLSITHQICISNLYIKFSFRSKTSMEQFEKSSRRKFSFKPKNATLRTFVSCFNDINNSYWSGWNVPCLATFFTSIEKTNNLCNFGVSFTIVRSMINDEAVNQVHRPQSRELLMPDKRSGMPLVSYNF